MSKYWNQIRSKVFKEANAIMRRNRREYSRHEALSMAWERSYRRPMFCIRYLLDGYYIYEQKHYGNFSDAYKRANRLEKKPLSPNMKDVEVVWNEEADNMLKMDYGF